MAQVWGSFKKDSTLSKGLLHQFPLLYEKVKMLMSAMQIMIIEFRALTIIELKNRLL